MTTCSVADARPLSSTEISRGNLVDWLLLVAPGVIWGGSFLFIAEGLEAVGPFGVAFMRIAIGFLTLSMIPAARRPIARGDWGTIVLIGVTSALTGMLNGASPLFTAAVAGIIARRLPHRKIAIGLAVGFGGAVLMAIPGSNAASGEWSGIAMILAALASYGIAFNLTGPLQHRNGALPVIWRALAVALVLTAPLGVPQVLAAQWKASSLLALLALGALGTGLAFVLFATAVGRMGATRASATAFLTPVVALVLGIAFRNERVSLLALLGAAICLGGAWLIRSVGVQSRRF
jgi:drug/metabolite transporter (DMT)-like permease